MYPKSRIDEGTRPGVCAQPGRLEAGSLPAVCRGQDIEDPRAPVKETRLLQWVCLIAELGEEASSGELAARDEVVIAVIIQIPDRGKTPHGGAMLGGSGLVPTHASELLERSPDPVSLLVHDGKKCTTVPTKVTHTEGRTHDSGVFIGVQCDGPFLERLIVPRQQRDDVPFLVPAVVVEHQEQVRPPITV